MTGTPTVDTRLQRLRHLADDANPAFAFGSVAVPVGVYAVAVLANSERLLFYTHVASGAVWFGLVLFFPAVMGPTLGSLSPEVAREFTTQFTSKISFFIFGFPLATVLSGTSLAMELGLFAAGGVWVYTALVLGWGLLVYGVLVVNPLHLKVYWEYLSETPDDDRLDRLQRRIIAVSLLDAGLLLVVVGVMTVLRLGPPG